MTRWAWIRWSIATGIAALATLFVWRGPYPTIPTQTPDPIPRPLSEEELRTLIDDERIFQALLTQAHQTLGRPLLVSEFEDTSANGQPFLADGVPDNPAIPGLSTIEASCSVTEHTDEFDWRYCEQDGLVYATVEIQGR